MVNLIFWLQFCSCVHGMKLEISIKPIDDSRDEAASINHNVDDTFGQLPLATNGFKTWGSKGGKAELKFKNKIVGGLEVKPPWTVPWQVAMIDKFSKTGKLFTFCGGVIICPKFVLTAAHCTENRKPDKDQVVVGLHDREAIESSISRHDIAQYHDHPDFKNIGEYSRYDYSILELVEPIYFKPEAKAVFLPKKGQEFNKDDKFLVSGWGALESQGHWWGSSKLMSVTVPWVSDQDCKAAYAEPKVQPDGTSIKYEIDESMICAGDITVGKIDACNGDSGGPMVWLDPATGQVQIIGLTSFGFLCAQANAPGVYAKLTTVMDWIKDIIGECNAETCEAGNCMTKEKVHWRTRNRLQTITRISS